MTDNESRAQIYLPQPQALPPAPAPLPPPKNPPLLANPMARFCFRCPTTALKCLGRVFLVVQLVVGRRVVHYAFKNAASVFQLICRPTRVFITARKHRQGHKHIQTHTDTYKHRERQGQRQQNKQKCKAIKSSPAEHNGISHIKHEQRHDFDFFACLLSITPTPTTKVFTDTHCGEGYAAFLKGLYKN